MGGVVVRVSATFEAADGTPEQGEVRLAPRVPGLEPGIVITQQPVVVPLVNGMFDVMVLASDAENWHTAGPVPYDVQVRLGGLWHEFRCLLMAPGPIDLSSVLPIGQPADTVVLPVPGPPGPLGIDSVQASAHALVYGEAPTVSATITGMPGARVLTADLGIPAGPQGIQGEQGVQGPQGIQGPRGEQGVPGEVRAADLAALRLQDLADVAAGAATRGDMLRWDGVRWLPLPEVVDVTSWAALPQSGWVRSLARVDALGLWAYWDGTTWRIDPRSDTGWVPVTTWSTAGVVSGVPLGDGVAPISGQAGGVWLRRHGIQWSMRIAQMQVSAAAGALTYIWGSWSLPSGWYLLQNGSVSLSGLGAETVTVSWLASASRPLLTGPANPAVGLATCTLTDPALAGTSWPTSLVIS